ncbi:alkylhydroperoxidase/carboxymuconolactone decarboxylase family protein YurZ [Bradyrhizobium sp. USDA 3397]
MSPLEQLSEQLPDFAKDIRLNLAAMMADDMLSPQKRVWLLLASAVATRNREVITAMRPPPWGPRQSQRQNLRPA